MPHDRVHSTGARAWSECEVAPCVRRRSGGDEREESSPRRVEPCHPFERRERRVYYFILVQNVRFNDPPIPHGSETSLSDFSRSPNATTLLSLRAMFGMLRGISMRSSLRHSSVSRVALAAGVAAAVLQPVSEPSPCMGKKRKKKASVVVLDEVDEVDENEEDEENFWEVDFIKARRLENGVPKYLIRRASGGRGSTPSTTPGSRLAT